MKRRPKVRPTRSSPDIGRGSTPNVGRDRDGHSTSVAKRVDAIVARAAAAKVFSWQNVQGWERPIIYGAGWHLWRHGRTACGAWQWRPQWGAPNLAGQPPSHHDACRRCAERSASRLRQLWRDRTPR